MKQSTPPLLRGTGTLLVMAAAVIAICIARQSRLASSIAPTIQRGQSAAPGAGGAANEHDVVDEVLENNWFDWVSIAGTAAIAASFFAEAYLRREQARSV